MSRRNAILAVLAAVAFAVLLALWWRGAGEADEPGLSTETAEPLVQPEQVELAARDLYFPGDGGRLYAEQRELPVGADLEERVTGLVEALLAGPQGAGIRPPLPDDVSVRRVYLLEGGQAVLDLASPEGAPPPPAGSQRERLMVYSLVNTVLLNFEEIETLVLLWNGEQPLTFAGHLDTSRPLRANPDLIASRSASLN